MKQSFLLVGILLVCFFAQAQNMFIEKQLLISYTEPKEWVAKPNGEILGRLEIVGKNAGLMQAFIEDRGGSVLLASYFAPVVDGKESKSAIYVNAIAVGTLHSFEEMEVMCIEKVKLEVASDAKIIMEPTEMKTSGIAKAIVYSFNKKIDAPNGSMEARTVVADIYALDDYYFQIKLIEPINGPNNTKVLEQMVSTFEKILVKTRVK